MHMYMGRHPHGTVVHSSPPRDYSEHDVLGLEGTETSDRSADKSDSA